MHPMLMEQKTPPRACPVAATAATAATAAMNSGRGGVMRA